VIRHTNKGVFKGLPNPLEVTRYHSLIVERKSLPDCLEVTATTDDGLIMGLRHKRFLVEGVQFHPESYVTQNGMDMLQNFLDLAAKRGTKL
jgi:anthranilate/para-aminobenzoate synthase component II